ncbi:GntR family transcriptional regulator [Amycolatopsis jejuensis]|uniref:GntR family transcriptional regulator n=1 Tax=Amycolatopsis jejuensis TaxID=330084 RepID=UPI00068E6B23|nr:GntR family transcriptional regulator [Amycolatopsis jejuensis]
MSDVAYAEIRRRIIAGDLQAGATYSEGDIAGRLGMSKAPVREALAALRRQGWLQALPRAGYLVSAVTVGGLRDLTAMLGWLFAEAAALAAKHADQVPHETAPLREYPEAPAGDVIAEDYEFHLRIARMSGNGELSAVLAGVLLKLQRYYFLDALSGVLPVPRKDVADLTDAIVRGDQDTARAEAARHAERIRGTALVAVLESAAVAEVNLATELPTAIGEDDLPVVPAEPLG